MTTKYTQIEDGVEARVHNGYLFVRSTDMKGDYLIQGGWAGRVRKMPYKKSLKEAKKTGKYNDPRLTDIKVCRQRGEIVKDGNYID